MYSWWGWVVSVVSVFVFLRYYVGAFVDSEFYGFLVAVGWVLSEDVSLLLCMKLVICCSYSTSSKVD
jgi:hypothetical protein